MINSNSNKINMKKIVAKEIRPLFTTVIVTEDCWEDDWIDNGVVMARKGDLKDYQRVIAVGHTCNEVKVGDLVKVDLQSYMVPMYKDNSIKNDMMGQENVVTYRVPKVIIDGKRYNRLTERDIDFIVTKYDEEEIEDSSEVIITE